MNYTKEAKKYIAQFEYPHCERCKTSSGRFSIHHIVYRGEAPKHENLHRAENFILCCEACHSWFHSKKSNRDELVKERGLDKLFPELIHLQN